MQLSILKQGRGGQGDVRLAQGGCLFHVLCSVPGGSQPALVNVGVEHDTYCAGKLS